MPAHRIGAGRQRTLEPDHHNPLVVEGPVNGENKGYDADSFVASLKVRAIKPVIPPKSNRKVKLDCDFALYAERNPHFAHVIAKTASYGRSGLTTSAILC